MFGEVRWRQERVKGMAGTAESEERVEGKVTC
jgi:hypothetical protein